MSMRLARNLLGAVSCAALIGGGALAAPPDAGRTAAPEDVKTAPAPAEPAPAAKPAPKPADAAKPAPAARPALPDGTFVGTLRKDKRSWPLRVTIVGAMIVHAEVERAGLEPMVLKPAGAPDAAAIRLTGRDANDYLQLQGALFDSERGAGRFDGTFARKRVQGTWVLARR